MKKISRRKFVQTCSVGMAGLSFPFSNCAKTQEKPNILWLISEDISPDFGCYGNSLVKTPNLDRLATEGTRFDNAFSTAPVCSPSRSAFNTGMYQTGIGAHQHRTKNKRPLPDHVRVITDYFRQAGYYTVNARGLQFDKKGKTDWNFTLDHAGFDGTDWRDRKPGQPFFAQVNLRLTHRPFVRDKENPIDPAAVKLPPFYPDHPVLRRDRADYLESIQVLDRQVATVLNRLEEDGLSENTLVFYFGDHGRAQLRAKQWLYEGGIRVPLIVRWPHHIKAGAVDNRLVSLIDLVPTSLGAARIPVPESMQGRDFLTEDRHNRRKLIFAARDRCDETVDRIRCVRSERFKYIRNFMPEKPYTQFNTYKTNRYPAVAVFNLLHKQGQLNRVQERFMAPRKPDEELYDLQNDSFETKNLATDPAYRKTLLGMCRQLDDWIKETGDMGAQPEAEEEIAFWQKRQADRHKMFMRKKGLPLHATPEQLVEYWEKKLLKKGFVK